MVEDGEPLHSRGSFDSSSKSNPFERDVQWRVDEKEEGLAVEGKRAVAGTSGLAVESLRPST